MAKKRVVKEMETPQGSALERFIPLLPADELALLMQELDKPLLPAFRRNPLKTQPGTEVDWARRYGWDLRPVPYCDSGWWVEAAQTTPSRTIEHLMGQFYIQEAASMLPVELFDWDGLEAPLVLDLAASPGGKTTHLIAKTGDRGLVIANDSSAERITALRLVLQNWGGLHAAVTNFFGEKIGRWFPDTFDRVLIDAPCSMQGLRSTDAHPMRPISDKERSALARRQVNLLDSALRAAKPGGQVVYSTCTLEPEEDEGVLDRLLKLYPGKFRIDDLSEQIPVLAPGLAEAYGQHFAPEVSHAARLWPHRYATAGFFAARLTKLAQEEEPGSPYPARPIFQAGWYPLERKSFAWLCGVFQEQYGLDLAVLIETHGLEIWRRSKGIYAFPEMFFQRFSDLPVQGLGLLVGEDTPDGFVPSHEWVARFGGEFQKGRYVLSEEQTAAWLRGEDIAGQPGQAMENDQVAILFDEASRLLGRGRVQLNRMKNLLPHRLL